MSDRLRIELLGGFRAAFGAAEPCSLPTRKAQALLAYLALPAGQFHSRDSLAALLWGNSSQTQARQSLRQALLGIRKLGDRQGEPLLLLRGTSVALDARLVSVDAADLQAVVADGQLEALESAVQLYKGRFLDGLELDEESFQEWRSMQSARLNELALQASHELLRRQIRLNSVGAAIQTAMFVLALDPLHEAARRELMQLLWRQGRRAAALQQYQACVALLHRELGTEPEEETKQLYQEILRSRPRTGRGRRSGASVPASEQQYEPVMRPPEVPLIGRTEEIVRLRSALQQAVNQGGRTMLVSGEAGIGKTRLLAELVRPGETGGVQLMIGRCHESERALPLHPWVEAIRGGSATLDPAVRQTLAAAAGGQLDRIFPELREREAQPVTSSEQSLLLFDALFEVIRGLGRNRPTILLIEDLHWADEMSARFAAYIARRIHQLPTFFIASVRSEEVTDAPAVAQVLRELRAEGLADEMPIIPLMRQESDDLLQSLAGARRAAPAMQRAADEIWTISRGNPFIIVELTRELLQTKVPMRRLPTRVEDSVTRRLDQLGQNARQIVNLAAAIGRDFSFDLIRRVAGGAEPDVAAAIDELVRRQILGAVGEQLGFCHEWLRRVAYDRVVPALRRGLHQTIAETLCDLHRDVLDEVAGEIGEHYLNAGDVRSALPFLIKAADVAVERYALQHALAILGEALSRCDDLPEPERDRRQLELILRQAFILSLQGHQHEILSILRNRAALVHRVADPALSSDYFARLALVHWYRGEHQQSDRVATEALRAGEQAGSAEHMGRAEYVLALNCAGLGVPQKGVAHGLRAVAHFDAPRTRHWRGLAHFGLALNQVIEGALHDALESARRCVEIGESEHDSRLTSGGRYIVAWTHVHLGDFEVAMEMAARTLESAKDAVAICLANGVYGWAAMEKGDTSSAVSHLEESVGRLRAMPLRLTEARFLALLSEAYLRAGEVERATTSAERANALSSEDGNPFTRALAERALGRIAVVRGDPTLARKLLSQALQRFEQVGTRIEAAQTQIDLAEILKLAGAGSKAHEHLRAAAERLEAAGAHQRAAKTRELVAVGSGASGSARSLA